MRLRFLAQAYFVGVSCGVDGMVVWFGYVDKGGSTTTTRRPKPLLNNQHSIPNPHRSEMMGVFPTHSREGVELFNAWVEAGLDGTLVDTHTKTHMNARGYTHTHMRARGHERFHFTCTDTHTHARVGA